MSEHGKPPVPEPNDVLRDVVQLMLDGGSRHAELRVSFDDMKARLFVTLVAVEYPDGTSAFPEEHLH